MKPKILLLSLVLFLGFAPTIHAQTTTQTITQTTARGSAKNTQKAVGIAPFSINETALQQLQTKIVVALNAPKERNISSCLMSDADITAWLANFTTPQNSSREAQKAAFDRMAATRTEATNRLQTLRGTAITATISKQEAQWGDPEQRSKAILVTLALKNASQESLRFYAVDCGGKYCLVSIK